MSFNPRWIAEGAAVLFLLLMPVLLLLRCASVDRCTHGEGAAAGAARPARGRTPLPPLTCPRVVIEKAAHRLTLYDGDRAVRSYRAAVGSGRGDKLREGDRCTPEGRFYVCLKNPESRFTLSLGLSYPGIEDADRGLRDGLIDPAAHEAIVAAIRHGRRPPWDTALGGEIMIHGDGAGRDWTLGCVALEDDDIRELYHALPLHTPVTILP